MKYISTRGNAPILDFEDAVIAGLAQDGGLYLPESWPEFSTEDISEMAGKSYQDIALKVMWPFVEGSSITKETLSELINTSYQCFNHKAITPITQIGNQEFVLELFHGPTLAFKDVALQFLGQVFDHILTKRNDSVTIVGATSGDTGSAAIYGCHRSSRVKLFIMHPHNRISEVQRRQMTTILSDNVFNIAVDGDFDFCQETAKLMLKDQSFLKGKTKLAAINSINWCRILAQIVYYFYSAVNLGSPDRKVSFSVPTGNFGDIFAGYVAKKMGLPIEQLVIATNENDILHRFMETGKYSRETLKHTLSPSMDIQVSSNFERLLFDAYERDSSEVSKLMSDFRNGDISVNEQAFSYIKQHFISYNVDDKSTCDAIKTIYSESEYIADPHTAIGIKAARVCRLNNNIPVICLATAHPAKFPESAEKASVPKAKLPEALSDLFQRKERYEVLPKDCDTIKSFVKNN